MSLNPFWTGLVVAIVTAVAVGFVLRVIGAPSPGGFGAALGTIAGASVRYWLAMRRLREWIARDLERRV